MLSKLAVLQSMPLKKLLGLIVMAIGIGWYSQIKLAESQPPKPVLSSTQAPPTPLSRRSSSPAAMLPASTVKAVPQRSGLPPPVPNAQLPPEGVGKSRSRQERAWPGQAISPRKSAAFDA